MSYESVGKLIDRWINDPQFRSEFRKDPDGTIKKAGVDLSKEERVALKKIDWKVSDEELRTRVSQAFG